MNCIQRSHQNRLDAALAGNRSGLLQQRLQAQCRIGWKIFGWAHKNASVAIPTEAQLLS